MPRCLTLVTSAVLALPTCALATVPPPAVVGAANVDDVHALARWGVAPAFGFPTAAVSSEVRLQPKVRGVVAAAGVLMQLPSGQVYLESWYGWRYRGSTVTNLAVDEWAPLLNGKWASRIAGYTADGGAVVVPDEDQGITGVDAQLRTRWAIPPRWSYPYAKDVPQPPVLVTPGDRAFAFGGTPAEIDATTGAVVHPLDPADAAGVVYARPMPDGGAVAVTQPGSSATGQGAPSVVRLRPDGTRAWGAPLSPDYPAVAGIAVAGNGTTYVAVATADGSARPGGRIVALAPDGQVLWQTSSPALVAGPVVDSAGNVWTLSSDGIVSAWASTGRETFRLRITTPAAVRSTSPVIATDGPTIVVVAGTTAVRLRPRRVATASVRPSLHVVPRLALGRAPFRCVAAPAGRPRTCLYRLDARPPIRVTSPVGGMARITLAPIAVTGRGPGVRRLPAPRPMTLHVLAGHTDIVLDPLDQRALWRAVCGTPRAGCLRRTVTYRVTVVLPLAARPRVLSATMQLTRGSGPVAAMPALGLVAARQ